MTRRQRKAWRRARRLAGKRRPLQFRGRARRRDLQHEPFDPGDRTIRATQVDLRRERVLRGCRT